MNKCPKLRIAKRASNATFWAKNARPSVRGKAFEHSRFCVSLRRIDVSSQDPSWRSARLPRTARFRSAAMATRTASRAAALQCPTTRKGLLRRCTGRSCRRVTRRSRPAGGRTTSSRDLPCAGAGELRLGQHRLASRARTVEQVEGVERDDRAVRLDEVDTAALHRSQVEIEPI